MTTSYHILSQSCNSRSRSAVSSQWFSDCPHLPSRLCLTERPSWSDHTWYWELLETLKKCQWQWRQFKYNTYSIPLLFFILISVRLPLHEECSCFLPGSIGSQSEAGCLGVVGATLGESSTDHCLLHAMFISSVRQIRKLAVFACGGNEYLRRLSNTFKVAVTRNYQS